MFFAAALTLSLQLQRATFDVLDAVNIEVVAHNSAKMPVNATFSSPAQYELDLLHGSDVVWTSLRPTPETVRFPPHTRSFAPGPNVLAVFIWNGIASDGAAPAPGAYTLRARMLTITTQAETSVPIRFINAVPVAALTKIKEGDEVTIAGTVDAAKAQLSDQTGTIRLARTLTSAPQASIVVRGYLTTAPDGAKTFFVERWARLRDSSTPVSIPSPAVRRSW